MQTQIIQPVTTTPYRKAKQFKAKLYQAGTSAPTAVVLRNTIGTITLSRSSQGIYLITSDALFKTDRTWIVIRPNTTSGSIEMKAAHLPQDDIQIRSIQNGTPTDSLMDGWDIVVEVWEE